jgi:hypothetical protein
VDPEYVRQFLVDYWIATYKEMKGLARQFDCFQFVGLYTERMMLLRAWHMDVTGTDVSGQVTIHLLSAMHQALDGQVAPGQEAVLGMPCRTPTETAQAIEAIRHEMTVVGRRLADKHGFAYPESLQAVVERTWRRKVESLISR